MDSSGGTVVLVVLLELASEPAPTDVPSPLMVRRSMVAQSHRSREDEDDVDDGIVLTAVGWSVVPCVSCVCW